MSKIIETLEKEQMDRKLPEFNPGDTILVQVKVKEGSRERLQAYEGVVMAKKNRGLNSSFTVRMISHGEGLQKKTNGPSYRYISGALSGLQTVSHGNRSHLRDRGPIEPG